MCKYCKNVKTGNDFDPVLKATVNLGRAGQQEIDVYLAPNAKLKMDILFPNPNDMGLGKEVKIKYCPMCGERLYGGE